MCSYRPGGLSLLLEGLNGTMIGLDRGTLNVPKAKLTWGAGTEAMIRDASFLGMPIDDA